MTGQHEGVQSLMWVPTLAACRCKSEAKHEVHRTKPTLVPTIHRIATTNHTSHAVSVLFFGISIMCVVSCPLIVFLSASGFCTTVLGPPKVRSEEFHIHPQAQHVMDRLPPVVLLHSHFCMTLRAWLSAHTCVCTYVFILFKLLWNDSACGYILLMSDVAAL